MQPMVPVAPQTIMTQHFHRYAPSGMRRRYTIGGMMRDTQIDDNPPKTGVSIECAHIHSHVTNDEHVRKCPYAM